MWRREIVTSNAFHADLITEHQIVAELDFYAKVQAFNCNNRDCVSEEAFLEGVGKVV